VIDNAVMILNGKGGVLKTTLSAQLAGLAALSGWRVLAIDLDQQGNLARDLGYMDQSDGGRNLLDAVLGEEPLAPLRNVRPDLDVVPGGPHHVRLYREIAAGTGGGLVPTYDELDSVLGPVAAKYDLVVIDAPPGGEAIHLAALTAARWLVIPTQPDQGSIDGLASVFRALNSVRKSTNPGISILGIVLGPISSQATRLRAETMEHLQSILGSQVEVFERTIRAAQLVAVQCRQHGLLVHEYEEEAAQETPWYKLSKEERKSRRNFSGAASGLAEDYQVLVQTILERITAIFAAEELDDDA
jgi:chromosome partitioning protein